MPAKRRRPTRAERRRAERERENAARRARGQEVLENLEEMTRRPRTARHRAQLEALEKAGVLHRQQVHAGSRLWGDYAASGGRPRLVARYEVALEQRPKRGRQDIPDVPAAERARRCFEQAIAAIGHPLERAIVLHCVICDLPLATWSPGPGVANGMDRSVELLRSALDALIRHYASAAASQGIAGGRNLASTQGSSRSLARDRRSASG